MRVVNKIRAELLTPIFRKPRSEEEAEEEMLLSLDCQLTVNSLAGRLLMGTFSYREDRQCNNRNLKDMRNLPKISANQSLLPDFSNFDDAVLENFSNPVCHSCNKNLTITNVEFGQLLFIEVNVSYKICK